MRHAAVIVLFAFGLAACSQAPTQQQTTLGTTYAPAMAAAPPQHSARHAVNVIGSPFYGLFKAVACVGSVAIAAPTAALIELTTRPDKVAMRRSLDAGVAHNCGGPAVLQD